MSGSNRTDPESLNRYVDGDLPVQEASFLESALESDAEARAGVAAYRSVKAALKRVPRQPAPPLLATRIRNRLDAVEEPRRQGIVQGILSLRWLTPLGAAAVVLIGISLFLQFRDAVNRTSSTDPGNLLATASLHAHAGCARGIGSGSAGHLSSADCEALRKRIQAEMNQDVQVPDLSNQGAVPVDAHLCRLGDVPCIHIYYEDARRNLLSYFVLDGKNLTGDLGVPAFANASIYRPVEDPQGSGKPSSQFVTLWKEDQGRIGILVGGESQDTNDNLVRKYFPHLTASADRGNGRV